ncbi:MAG: HAMP domain-containing protein, partial [Thiobacillus sp.]|nr:HAMP domain-containing protein [Thiobacillus sp.]
MPPIPPAPTTIRRKLIWLLLGVSGLGMVFVLAFSAWQQLSNIQTDAAERLRAIARATAGAGNAALAFRDAKAARTVLQDSLGEHGEIVAAAIYDRQGTLFATYGRAEQLPAELHVSRETRPAIRPFDPVAWDVNFIRVDGEPIGLVYLRADLSPEWRRFAAQFALSAGGILLAFTLSLLIGLRLVQRVVTPINALSVAAGRVRACKDYSLRVERHSDDEVGVLVDGFNAMLAEIETRDRELADSHNVLERLVAQRTAQLETAKVQAEAADR